MTKLYLGAMMNYKSKGKVRLEGLGVVVFSPFIAIGFFAILIVGGLMALVTGKHK